MSPDPPRYPPVESLWINAVGPWSLDDCHQAVQNTADRSADRSVKISMHGLGTLVVSSSPSRCRTAPPCSSRSSAAWAARASARATSRRSSKHSRSNRNVAGTCKRLDSTEFHEEDTGSLRLAGGVAWARCGCRGPVGSRQVQVFTGGLGSCWNGSEVLTVLLTAGAPVQEPEMALVFNRRRGPRREAA